PHDLVAGTSVLSHTLAANPEPRARLSSGRNLQHHVFVVDGPDPHLRAERRLHDVDRDGADEIQAFPREETIRLDPERDEQVSPGPTGRSGLALAREPELRSRVDPRGDVDLKLPLGPARALPLARRARGRGNRTAPVACGARTGHGEAALSERDHPGPLALGTRRGSRPRCRTVPPARRA